MKIKNIKIYNFRSILNEEFFLNDYSVLVGENNSGKSNIISAIRVFYGDLKFDKSKDSPKNGKNDLVSESHIDIKFQLNEKEYEVIDKKYQNAEKTLSLRKNLITDKTHAIKEDGTLHDEQFYGAKGVSEGKIGKIVFIPSVSKTEDILKTTGVSPFRNIINYIICDIIEKSPEFEKINSQLGSLKETLLDNKNRSGDSIATIQQRIKKELNSWENIDFQISMNHITSDMILKNLVSPVLIDQNISSEVDFDKFGQGFQRGLIASLIKIDSEIRQNKKNEESGDKTRKVYSPDFTLILFEEPEAFLHFTQEEKMNKNLSILSREEDRQVLISTHSNFFTSRNIEDLTNIIKIEKEDSTTISQLTKDELSDLLDNNKSLSKVLVKEPTYEVNSESLRYFLWLNQDRTSLFFAKKILLVEGSTEKMFFDYLLNDEWDDIKPEGLCVIDTNGKHNTVRFINLLNKFKIKHFVLFDKDDNKTKNGVNHKILNEYIFENIQTPLCLNHDTFEKDIEDFLGITTENDKPLNILYKYKTDEITKEKLFSLKLKLKRLFMGDKDFDLSEELISKIISLYNNFDELSRVSVGDNGEWSYKYNLAQEFFKQYDFEKSFSVSNGSIYRSKKDGYYWDVCKNITKGYDDGFYPFYELLTRTSLHEDEEKNIIEIFNFVKEKNL